jgi:hypothetical protein
MDRFLGHPHRAATQFDRFPIFTRHQLVVVKSFRWLVRCRLDRFLESRLARHRRTRGAPRSMHTGQNSIAPENSLPQLGQVRWMSALMGLTVLRRSEPKTTPRSTEWCESGQHGPWQTVVPFHKLVCSIICAASGNRNEKHQTLCGAASRISP